MFGEECICERCGRRYIHDWRKGHTARRCNSCRNTRWRDRRLLKQRMVDYKGGACVLCGYRLCLRALDFHHLWPDEKRFTLAHGHQRSWASLRRELDGCMLVCSNCHIELEADVARPRVSRDDPDADSTCDRCGRRFRYRRPGMIRTRCNSCCSSRPQRLGRSSSNGWSNTRAEPVCFVDMTAIGEL